LTSHGFAHPPTPRPLSSSIAGANDRVYSTDLGGRATALDAATGAQLWRKDASEGQWNVQRYGSPVPLESSLVFGICSLQEAETTVQGFQGGVVKLDQATAAIEWRFQTVCDERNGGTVWNTPSVGLAHRLIFLGTGNLHTPPSDVHSDSMMAIDLDTGAEVWDHPFLDDDAWTPTTGAHGPDSDFGASPNRFTVGSQPVVGQG